MSIQIIVNGHDLTNYYRSGTATINDLPGGEIGKASFVLENPMVPNPPTMPLVHNPMFPLTVTDDMPDPDDYTNLVRYRPESGHVVVIRDTEDQPGINIFVGSILRKPEEPVVRTEDNSYHFVYTVQAATAGYTLDGHYVTDIWDEKQTGFIFKNVIETYAPDFDNSEIPTSGPSAGRFRRPQYVAERQPARHVLDDLAGGEGWSWYIEETEPTSLASHKKIKLGPPIKVRELFRFTDDTVDDMCNKLPTIDLGDLTQVRNVIHFEFFGEYATLYDGSGSVSNPLAYDKGLARIALNDPNIQPLGEANWASYIKPGAVFYIPGSNYRYTVAQVFENGNITLNTPVQDASGDVPYVFSNIPMTVKLKDQTSINTLKALFNNGDNGEREFVERVSQLMTFEQGFTEARARLSDRSNPMVRMSLETDTYLLRRYTDWTLSDLGVTGTKVHPKAGKAVEFNLPSRNLVGLFITKQVVWRDTKAIDKDYRQMWKITLDYSDRLFALTTIFRRLIDGQLNGFSATGSQSIFDVIDIYERDSRLISALSLGGGEQVILTYVENPWINESIVVDELTELGFTTIDMAINETVPLLDVGEITDLSTQTAFRWSYGASPAINRAKWGRAQWVNIP